MKMKMKQKTYEQIQFLKLFKNPFIKFFAYMFKYRLKTTLAITLSLILSAVFIFNKADIIKIYPFNQIFSQEVEK